MRDVQTEASILASRRASRWTRLGRDLAGRGLTEAGPSGRREAAPVLAPAQCVVRRMLGPPWPAISSLVLCLHREAGPTQLEPVLLQDPRGVHIFSRPCQYEPELPNFADPTKGGTCLQPWRKEKV